MKGKLTKAASGIFILFAAAGAVTKQTWTAPRATRAFHAAQGLSDIVQDIWIDHDVIYIATADGLGVSRDGGAHWQSFREPSLPANNVLAVAAGGGDIWASCIDIKYVGNEQVLIGRGLAHYDAETRRWEVIGNNRGLPVEGEGNVAWDVWLDDAGTVWVATWMAGLARSTDGGQTWTLLAPKDRRGVPSHHFYAIYKKGNLIWAAAEMDDSSLENIIAGVFKSENNGATWTFYGKDEGVDGFCVAVNVQEGGARDAVWVGTAPPVPWEPEGKGLYRSPDGGATWQHFTRNDGLGGNTVYGAASAAGWFWAGTDDGVSRTDDDGNSWRTATTNDGLPDDFIYCLGAVSAAEVWAGTAAGLALSEDSGKTWRRVYLSPKPKPLDLDDAFAFPSPFSAARDGFVTFRYALDWGATVKLDVYDFAGRRVKRVVDNEYRAPGERIDERWDGRRENGALAANGVYFFVIQINGTPKARGKFVIVQ